MRGLVFGSFSETSAAFDELAFFAANLSSSRLRSDILDWEPDDFQDRVLASLRRRWGLVAVRVQARLLLGRLGAVGRGAAAAADAPAEGKVRLHAEENVRRVPEPEGAAEENVEAGAGRGACPDEGGAGGGGAAAVRLPQDCERDDGPRHGREENEEVQVQQKYIFEVIDLDRFQSFYQRHVWTGHADNAEVIQLFYPDKHQVATKIKERFFCNQQVFRRVQPDGKVSLLWVLHSVSPYIFYNRSEYNFIRHYI